MPKKFFKILKSSQINSQEDDLIQTCDLMNLFFLFVLNYMRFDMLNIRKTNFSTKRSNYDLVYMKFSEKQFH